MKRILIVTDDAHTGAWISSAVDSLDLSVGTCAISELSDRVTAEEPTLAIVDAGRDADSLVQVFERLAPEGLQVGVLFLVEPEALSALRMPVRLPADFVVRGATSAELAARVRALVWPGEEPVAQEIVRADNLAINLATYQAHIDGAPVDFTYLEYALFAFLVTHPNRAYSREMLLKRVWGTDYYGGSRTVDVHIRRVRAKIGPELSGRLETVRHVGYLWHG